MAPIIYASPPAIRAASVATKEPVGRIAVYVPILTGIQFVVAGGISSLGALCPVAGHAREVVGGFTGLPQPIEKKRAVCGRGDMEKR